MQKYTSKEWHQLNESKKMQILRSYYSGMLPIVRTQLETLAKSKKEVPEEYMPAYTYLWEMLNEYWQQLDFIVNIGRTKFRKFNKLIIRSLFEKLLQIGFFSGRPNEERNTISLKEQVRIIKKFYEREEEANKHGWEKFYDNLKSVFPKEFKKNNLPNNISHLAKPDYEPFPTAKYMCDIVGKQFSGVNPEQWYHDYKYFCEFDHNGFFLIWQADEKSQYRQNFMIAIAYSIHLLKIIDKTYIHEKTKEQIEIYTKKYNLLKQVD